VTTEFSSALSIKLCSRQIEAVHRADALAMFTRLSADSFIVLPISGLQFRTAPRFVDQYARIERVRRDPAFARTMPGEAAMLFFSGDLHTANSSRASW
jgi:hypothetical protein